MIPGADPGETVRSILTSLACKYRLVLEQLQLVTGRRVQVVHVVGGGTRNPLLRKLTADLLCLPVLAGPEEATALGNALVQARAAQSGDENYERFLAVTGLASQRPAHAEV